MPITMSHCRTVELLTVRVPNDYSRREVRRVRGVGGTQIALFGASSSRCGRLLQRPLASRAGRLRSACRPGRPL